MSHLIAGRAQMGTSLAFHLSFAVFGVGLPVMMLTAEGLHLRTGDPVWLALARRWSKAFAILFAVRLPLTASARPSPTSRSPRARLFIWTAIIHQPLRYDEELEAA